MRPAANLRFQDAFAAACAVTIPVAIGFAGWQLRNSPSIGIRTFGALLVVVAVGFGGAVLYILTFMLTNPDSFPNR